MCLLYVGSSTLGTDFGAELSVLKMLSKLANYLRGKGGGEDAPCKLKTDQSQEGILRKTKGTH